MSVLDSDFSLIVHEEIIEFDRETSSITGYAVIIEKPSIIISVHDFLKLFTE